MKPAAFRNVSQTTLSAAIGVAGALAYVLLPYMLHSPNAGVRAFAGVLMTLGFGNGLRAAADERRDDCDGDGKASS